MIALIFIISATLCGMFVSASASIDPTWLTYYRGAVIGLFISSVILQLRNKKRRSKETTIRGSSDGVIPFADV